MLARKPKMLVTVALANKMARIIWALLVKGGTYRTPVSVHARGGILGGSAASGCGVVEVAIGSVG